MTIGARFNVTLQVPNIGRVTLTVPRTASDIADLRTRYDVIEVTPTAKPSVANPSHWSAAVGALVRLRQSAQGKGDTELLARAEAAIGCLFGRQKHIDADAEEHTLIGLGARR